MEALDDHAEQSTSGRSDQELLKTAYINEKAAPEVLPFQEDLISRIEAQIDYQVCQHAGCFPVVCGVWGFWLPSREPRRARPSLGPPSTRMQEEELESMRGKQDMELLRAIFTTELARVREGERTRGLAAAVGIGRACLDPGPVQLPSEPLAGFNPSGPNLDHPPRSVQVRYLLRSYYRVRLHKIEASVMFILDNPEVKARLSQREDAHAQDFFMLQAGHLRDAVAQALPDSFSSLVRQTSADTAKDMLTPPDLNRHIFCRVLRDLGSVQLDDKGCAWGHGGHLQGHQGRGKGHAKGGWAAATRHAMRGREGSGKRRLAGREPPLPMRSLHPPPRPRPRPHACSPHDSRHRHVAGMRRSLPRTTCLSCATNRCVAGWRKARSSCCDCRADVRHGLCGSCAFGRFQGWEPGAPRLVDRPTK